MNYYKSWSKTISENQFLKSVVLILCITVTALGICIINFMAKDPLLIERACYAKAVDLSSEQKRNAAEIESFLVEAVSQRFDTGSGLSTFLSTKEMLAKRSDLKELAEKKLTQKLLVKDVEIKDGFALVSSDRILSSEKLKAALDFKVKAYFTTTQRSASNPSGLILSKTEPLEKKESK